MTLYYPILSCFTLYGTIVFYTIWYYRILHYMVLSYFALYGTIVFYTTLNCTIALHNTTLDCTILSNAQLYFTILLNTILHYTTLFCNIQCYTTLAYRILHYTALLNIVCRNKIGEHVTKYRYISNERLKKNFLEYWKYRLLNVNWFYEAQILHIMPLNINFDFISTFGPRDISKSFFYTAIRDTVYLDLQKKYYRRKNRRHLFFIFWLSARKSSTAGVSESRTALQQLLKNIFKTEICHNKIARRTWIMIYTKPSLHEHPDLYEHFDLHEIWFLTLVSNLDANFFESFHILCFR